MQEAGITGAPAELLLNWLHQRTYDLYIDKLQTCIPTNRGVKQGCPASPLLSAAFMTLVTKKISARLTDAWVAQCLTMFADDFHIGIRFHNFHELETLCSQVGFIMSTLGSHGMSVHATKAQAILSVEGTSRCTALKKLTRTCEGGRFLRIHARQGDENLPLVRQTDYLGAVTTYDSCASHCVLHLWIVRGTAAQAQVLVLRHLRGIARCPAHITHESDVALLARLHVPLPRDALRKTFESAFGRQEPNDPHVLPFDHPWNLHCSTSQFASPHRRRLRPPYHAPSLPPHQP